MKWKSYSRSSMKITICIHEWSLYCFLKSLPNAYKVIFSFWFISKCPLFTCNKDSFELVFKWQSPVSLNGYRLRKSFKWDMVGKMLRYKLFYLQRIKNVEHCKWLKNRFPRATIAIVNYIFHIKWMMITIVWKDHNQFIWLWRKMWMFVAI